MHLYLFMCIFFCTFVGFYEDAAAHAAPVNY